MYFSGDELEMYPGAQDHARAVDDVMRFIVWADIILFVIVVGAMFWFVYKYHKKRHPRAVSIHGNVTLEVIWTVVPVILVLYMFYLGWSNYVNTRFVPKDSIPVKVIARQWSWTFQYANGKQADSLYVPQGRPIKCLLTSVDVLHGFYIPAFRQKLDAIPGRVRYLMLYPNEIGTYEITCSQYCGLNHALMETRMIVLPKEQFDKWLGTGVPKEEAAEATTGNP